jgi:hypothetical protein
MDGVLPLHGAAAFSTLRVAHRLAAHNPEALGSSTPCEDAVLPDDGAIHNVQHPEVIKWLELAMRDIYGQHP